MRTIYLTNERSVEVWPGRKLFVRGELHKLPSGSMSLLTGNETSTIQFGSISRTTAILAGRTNHITAIFDGIVAMERPEGALTIE